MDEDILKMLQLPLTGGQIELPDNGTALFLNGYGPALPALSDISALYQQYDYGRARMLMNTQMAAQPDIPDQGAYDLVLIAAPQQRRETLYLIARGLKLLKENGYLVCAAANNAGGQRLKKDITAAGLAPTEISKHKCRSVWAQKTGTVQDKINLWIQGGDEQHILDEKYISQPGIFGWDKIDTGSEILAYHLPEKLKGAGADFGCGYGYLSSQILSCHHDIKALYCIDSDYRAIHACAKNLDKFSSETNIKILWHDIEMLAHDHENALSPGLDWIVMNPPFHSGKAESIALGQNFIRQAAFYLKKNGYLYMVANAHLPYEALLTKEFSKVENIQEQKGFKIFHAQK